MKKQTRIISLILTLVLCLSFSVFATEDKPAYSVEGFETVDSEGNRITTGRDATSSVAIASASKYEVSQVGAEILAKGGNAVDAAVAMGFALAVAEPFTNGPGGGGFAVIHTADGENLFVDFREIGPAAATFDLYLDAEGKYNRKAGTGGLASGIPGDVAGLLYMLENHGSGNLTREEILEPAIRIAEEGFYISTYAANAISNAYEKAQNFPEMQKIYWDENGLPYEEGHILKNPDFAKTLRIIAEKGRDGFYKGEVAQAIVDSLAKYEGVMTLEDLAGYEVTVTEPVSGTYRGYTLLSSSPPSSGGTILIEILNILENYDVSKLTVNSPEYIHLFVEAFKLAYADRAQYMADEAFTDVPLVGLTSKDYAKERAKLIDLEKANEYEYGDPTLFEGSNTSHYSVADVQGNCVAVTKTINGYFGSGVLVDGYGFMMNNEMADFSTSNPESVNKVEPGKKPLSSMSPTIVLKDDGSPFLVLGTPGGARIFVSVLQIISRVIDHEMSLHDAICVPKIWNTGATNNFQYETPLKGYEIYAITEETVAKLTEMGHDKIRTAASGAVQAIEYLDDGTVYGTADPRQDGKAVGVE
ncbi:MAG: gamma-glutamyltransferase [Christensenellales bacterium]|jgi:gamma-glutamyltranspeptidase/glutathione hydrolase